MTEFKIRAYGRMELAQLYSPTLTDIAAYRKMKKWISLCPGLLQRLYKEGKSKEERFEILSEIAKYQLNILNNAEKIKLLGESKDGEIVK